MTGTKRVLEEVCFKTIIPTWSLVYCSFFLSFATRVASPRQHVPIAVGSYCLDMLILVRKKNRRARRKIIEFGNSSHMTYHTRLGFSGEKYNALTACATYAFSHFCVGKLFHKVISKSRSYSCMGYSSNTNSFETESRLTLIHDVYSSCCYISCWWTIVTNVYQETGQHYINEEQYETFCRKIYDRDSESQL